MSIFVYIIILILILNIIINQKEDFCPNKLTYEGDKYLLWENRNLKNIFYNYYDYLKYYHFLQGNYNLKNKFCTPLLPQKNTLRLSNNPMDKNWIGNKQYYIRN